MKTMVRHFPPAAAAPDLSLGPVPKEWIREGTPVARWAPLWTSADRMAHTVLWECSAGTFDWHYNDEETVHILEGEVHVTPVGGEPFRLGPGDTAVFDPGAVALWHIPERVRKVAVLRRQSPLIFTLGARVWLRLFPRRDGGGL